MNKLLFALLILSVSSSSNAGFAGGPYFIFANFSNNNKAVDAVINKRLAEREDCLVRGRKYVVDTKLPRQASAQWEEFCKLVPKITRPN